ncbi:MAG: GAF domain-containing protein [Jaaginema sp. PMC 1079.18]|nr:GAF domain-containing protein [Jaaginema sp. PMC 1080.18]MEC4850338.1 GAF domain-containing protein [Jaaginema sp. PMC 1079.18]MEC4865591.1 GAF domain-containing protein [Jaaginema sp. PMC 1078.18]
MPSEKHQTSALNSENSLEKLFHRITGRIRSSLELNQILSATVAEVSDYLQTDRIKIYRFDTDGSGEVVAEYLRGSRLPSLLGLHFPADDIPETARELFAKLGVRSIVDVEAATISMSLGESQVKDWNAATEILDRELDFCHQEYLTAMGVKSSIVIPIKLTEALTPEPQVTPEDSNHPAPLWGLLISHHATTRSVSAAELRMLQWVSDQVAIAISQSQLLQQANRDRQHQATVNHIATLLHSLQTIKLQHALIETVSALNGSGGRLYLQPQSHHRDADLYTCGTGEALKTPHKKYRYLEEHPAWFGLFPLEVPEGEDCPVISTQKLLQDPRFSPLLPSFENSPIRGAIIVPLYSRSQFLGSLTIFRDETSTETLWAGYHNPDRKQQFPRQSFEMWRQCHQNKSLPWQPSDLQLGHTLAQQFAAAIYQHRLYQQVRDLNSSLESQVTDRTAQLQKSLDFAQVLRQVSEQIRSSLDLTTTLQTIASEALNLLNSDRVFIYRFDRNWLGQVVVEEIQECCASCRQSQLCLDFPETEIKQYQTGKVRTINNVALEPLDNQHRQVLQTLQVQASLIVPIGLGHQLWGLLGVHECRAPRKWLDSEISLIQHLAEQAVIAITQAELYEHSNEVALVATERAYELERAAEQQRSLFRVIGKIRQSLDVETIFETAVTEVRRLLNSDRVGIFRLDADSNYTDGIFVAEAVKEQFPSAISAKVRDRCFGEDYAQDYRHGRIQAIADIYAANLSDCHIEILERFGIRANLVIPVMRGDRLWGLLCIHQCQKPRSWTDSEIEFVKQIAVHLGIALQQSSLLRQTQEQAADLTHTLHQLQKAQTQLIQTEKMSSLGHLVAGIAHEINNPVNFIYGNLSHLSDYTQDLLDLLAEYQTAYPNPKAAVSNLSEAIDLEFLKEDLPRLLSSLQVGSERIRHLVLSLRNFSHHDQAERKAVDIHTGIDNTLLILQHRLKKNQQGLPIKIQKNYGDLPPIDCYAGQLNQVFMNIISNAIDALDDHSAPQITITTQIAQKERHPCPHAIIKISDNGMGMSASVKKSIFDPFFTTKPIGKGTGLGLAISYQIIVDRHGGFLRCESQPLEGTTFMIEIPTY